LRKLLEFSVDLQEISRRYTDSVQNVGVNLTPEERQFAAARLAQSQARLHALAAGLTTAQWTFRDGDAWSPLLIVEHVYVVEAGALRAIAAAPPSAETRPERDARVLKWIPDRSRKAVAPERVVPPGRITDPAALLAKFDEARARSLEWLHDSSSQPRLHALPHPFLGMLDGYQWLLVFALHLERHLEQIEELKSRPNFP
jgi:hypothetical protein